MLGSDESVTAEVLDIRPFPFRERSADPESSFLEQVSSEKSEVGSASLRRGRYVSRTSFLTPVNPTPSYQPIAVPGKQIIRTPPPRGTPTFSHKRHLSSPRIKRQPIPRLHLHHPLHHILERLQLANAHAHALRPVAVLHPYRRLQQIRPARVERLQGAECGDAVQGRGGRWRAWHAQVPV